MVCGKIISIGIDKIRIMELIQLGTIDKGSVSLQSKYVYLTSRWFRSKHKKNTDSKIEKLQTYNDVYIELDVIITMKCKQGVTYSAEYYRVPVIFSKYYNKLFVHIDGDRIMWSKIFNKYKVFLGLRKSMMSDLKRFSRRNTGTWVHKQFFPSITFVEF